MNGEAPAQDSSYPPHIVSVGELLWDIFPDREHLGGSAANVAFHAARLGAHSSLISRVGADERGRRACALLEGAGVDCEGVSTDPRRPTGSVSVQISERGQPSFEIGEDAAWDELRIDKHLPGMLRAADAVVFGTLAQRTVLAQGRLQTALTQLRRCPIGERPQLVLDLNLRPPFTDPGTVFGAIRLADVIKLNEQELLWLSQSSGSVRPLDWLFANSPARLIALTRGRSGAALIGRVSRVMGRPAPAVGGDPVGAGDAFVAALALGLSRGASLPALLNEANRQAAWVASQQGAMPGGKGPRSRFSPAPSPAPAQ